MMFLTNIFKKYISFLSHVDNIMYSYKLCIVVIILVFIIAHVFTFIENSTLYITSIYFLISFYFSLQDSFKHFVQDRASSNKCILKFILFIFYC